MSTPRSLRPDQRTLLKDVLANSGVREPINDEDTFQRFDEIMDVLAVYLLTYGVGPDDELNALGHRIEEIEDVLLRHRIEEESD